MNEVLIPSQLSQMKLKDYMAINQLLIDFKDDEKELERKIINYYTGYKDRQIDKMSMVDYQLIVDNVYSCMRERPQTHSIVVKLGDKNFGFLTNAEQMDTEEFLDIDLYLTKVDKWDEMLSIMYRPITRVVKTGWFRKTKSFAYDIEEYTDSKKYASDMLELKASDAVGAYLFFYRLKRDCLRHSLSYIQKLIGIEKCPETKKSLITGMEGILGSILLLEETVLNSKTF